MLWFHIPSILFCLHNVFATIFHFLSSFFLQWPNGSIWPFSHRQKWTDDYSYQLKSIFMKFNWTDTSNWQLINLWLVQLQRCIANEVRILFNFSNKNRIETILMKTETVLNSLLDTEDKTPSHARIRFVGMLLLVANRSGRLLREVNCL